MPAALLLHASLHPSAAWAVASALHVRLCLRVRAGPHRQQQRRVSRSQAALPMVWPPAAHHGGLVRVEGTKPAAEQLLRTQLCSRLLCTALDSGTPSMAICVCYARWYCTFRCHVDVTTGLVHNCMHPPHGTIACIHPMALAASTCAWSSSPCGAWQLAVRPHALTHSPNDICIIWALPPDLLLMAREGECCESCGATSSPVNTSLFPSPPPQAPPPCPSPLHLSDNSYPSPLLSPLPTCQTVPTPPPCPSPTRGRSQRCRSCWNLTRHCRRTLRCDRRPGGAGWGGGRGGARAVVVTCWEGGMNSVRGVVRGDVRVCVERGRRLAGKGMVGSVAQWQQQEAVRKGNLMCGTRRIQGLLVATLS